MSDPAPNITIPVDLTNPGQFFACCGLLELADRLWPGAEGWFNSRGAFHISRPPDTSLPLTDLIAAIGQCNLVAIDPDDPCISPLRLGVADGLRIDWWLDDQAGGDSLKTWSGQQKVIGVSLAMRNATARIADCIDQLLDHRQMVFDPAEEKKVVEPFYFDARRAGTALDIGFSPDAQSMSMDAYPAVEFLCLVGLQRFRPKPLESSHNAFDYFAWMTPLPPFIAAACAGGSIPCLAGQRYRFQLMRRDNQGRYKAFTRATFERSKP